MDCDGRGTPESPRVPRLLLNRWPGPLLLPAELRLWTVTSALDLLNL